MQDDTGGATVEERIHSYAVKYNQLFPNNIDLKRVWEISQLHADSILAADENQSSLRQLLTSFLFDKNASTWTRSISGAALVHHYHLERDEDVAVKQLIQALSPDSITTPNTSNFMADYTADDIVMISLYALNVSKIVKQGNLHEFLIESCTSILEYYSAQLNSQKQNSTESACLSVLSTLLTSGTQISLNLRAEVHRNPIKLLERFFSLLYSKNLSPSVSREHIAKRLISPILQLIGAESTRSTIADEVIDLISLHCNRLAGKEENDLDVCSSLLCVLMSITPLNAMERLCRNDLWKLLSSFFLSSDAVVRKRAAFIMQLVPTGEAVLHHLPEHEAEKDYKKKKSVKGKKTGKSDGNDGSDTPKIAALALHSIPPSRTFHDLSIVTNSVTGKRAWWSDFLDVYGQIEGCTSMHLVDQIWPQLEHLCHLAAASSADKDDVTHSDSAVAVGVEYCYPTIGFVWVKSLLHILLQISIPGIRKAVFRRILVGGVTDCDSSEKGLELSASRQSIAWVCGELLPLVDTVNFFSAYFIPPGLHIGCTDNMDTISDHYKINALAHPGILMPAFLGRLLKSLAVKDQATTEQESLVQVLICSVVHAVCGENGLHSLSATKWILRVFAEPSILPLIPRCLGPVEVREISAFLRGRLACSNGVVREHVLQGLLPLFLGGLDPSTVPLTDLLLMVTSGSCFGLDKIISNSEFFSLLQGVVLESCCAAAGGKGPGCPLIEVDGHLLAIAYAIAADQRTIQSEESNGVNKSEGGGGGEFLTRETPAGVMCTLKALSESNLALISQLYRAPFLEREAQLKALRFLSGIMRTVVIAHSPLSSSQTSELTSEAVCLSLSSPLMLFPHLNMLRACSSDLASYLSIALCAALTATKESLSGAFKSSQSVLLIDDVTLLDDCASMLGGLLLLYRLPETSLAPSPSTVAALVHKGVESSILAVITGALQHLAALLSKDPSSSLCNVLTVKCVYSLLSAVQASSPYSASDPDTVNILTATISQIVTLLTSISQPTSSLFRSFLEVQGLNGGMGDGVEHPKSVLIDLARVTDFQFGRVSTMFVEHRWAGIRAGLELLVLANTSNHSSLKSIVSHSTSDRGSDGDGDRDCRLFSLAIDQLDSCSMSSLPDILSCCLVVVRRVCVQPQSEEKRNTWARLIIQLLDAAWLTTTGGSAYTDVRAINSFVRLAFDVSVLKSLDHAEVRRYYDCVEALGLKNRPHIMQSLTAALCSAWSVDAALAAPFFSLLPRLLLYREPKQDDHNVPDNTGHNVPDSDAAGAMSGICRFSVLLFLETCLEAKPTAESAYTESKIYLKDQSETRNELLTKCLEGLIVELVALNEGEDFVQSAMIGSDLYGQKLRCWQALCVLTRYITEPLLRCILETYFTTMTHSAGHSIRVHVELFGAAMAIKFPSVMMPRLLRALRDFNHSQQTLCSLFVVLGHAVLDDPSATLDLPSTGTALDRSTAQEVVNHLLPWLACGAGLSRTVAQLLMHSLIPVVLDSPDSHPSPDTDMGQFYLRSILKYLGENKDSAKGMPKQRKFFTDYNPSSHCSVQGLSLLGVDSTGEVVAPHILNFLAETLKAEVEMDRERSKISHEHLTPSILIGDITTTVATLQTKRVPFDELQLNLQSEVLSRQLNAAGRKRQEVVICASLIDKVTNLAGIARTCEIFAVQELVLANLGVVQTDAFQGIAVSCDQWLPMSEVPVHSLSVYLSDMRGKGYTILGLEQTDNSQDLGVVTELPSKCVLLLGREKEGIPVELLQEIDCCLEIPQYGVIRSLNVHVSAALAIWEITKLNKNFLADVKLNPLEN
jgi:tRNA G18 (ribose-2'-O)-methylase SpoU